MVRPTPSWSQPASCPMTQMFASFGAWLIEFNVPRSKGVISEDFHFWNIHVRYTFFKGNWYLNTPQRWGLIINYSYPTSSNNLSNREGIKNRKSLHVIITIILGFCNSVTSFIYFLFSVLLTFVATLVFALLIHANK